MIGENIFFEYQTTALFFLWTSNDRFLHFPFIHCWHFEELRTWFECKIHRFSRKISFYSGNSRVVITDRDLKRNCFFSLAKTLIPEAAPRWIRKENGVVGAWLSRALSPRRLNFYQEIHVSLFTRRNREIYAIFPKKRARELISREYIGIIAQAMKLFDSRGLKLSKVDSP